MQVHVHFTAQLRAALDRSQQTFALPAGSTLADLLRELANAYPDACEKFVLRNDGQLQPNMILCVDDTQVTQFPQFELHDGASVTLLSAISGG